MTDETFAAMIALLEETYREEFSPERKRVWRVLLGDIPDDAVQRATVQLCRRSPFPPKPADIWRVAVGAAGQPDPEAVLLEEAEAAIRFLQSHLRDDAAIDMGAALNQIVRDFGGPIEIVREIQEGEWRFRRSEAVRAYMHHRRTGVVYLPPEQPDKALRDPDHEIQQAIFPTREIVGLPSPAHPGQVQVHQLPEPFAPDVAVRGLQMIREATDAHSPESGTAAAGPERDRAG